MTARDLYLGVNVSTCCSTIILGKKYNIFFRYLASAMYIFYEKHFLSLKFWWKNITKLWCLDFFEVLSLQYFSRLFSYIFWLLSSITVKHISHTALPHVTNSKFQFTLDRSSPNCVTPSRGYGGFKVAAPRTPRRRESGTSGGTREVV